MSKANLFSLYSRGAVLSFNAAATSALIPSIALSLGKDPLEVGKMIWLYMIPYGVFALLYVPLSSAVNIKTIAVISFLLFSLSNLLLGLSHSLSQVFIFRVLAGVFGASVVPIAFFTVGVGADSKKRGKTLGIFFSLTFASSLCGLFLSGLINWRYIYIIPGVLGVILSGYECFFFSLGSKAYGHSRLSFNYLNALRNRKVYSIFMYIFIISIFYHSIRQWLGVYFYKTFSLGQFLISSLLLVMSLAGILGEFSGGFLSDREGRTKVVNLGIVFMVVSLALIALGGHMASKIIHKQMIAVYFIPILAVFGTGWTFNHIGLSAMIADLPDSLLSYASGLNSSVRSLAGGIGALLGGVIIKSYGFVLLFVIGVLGLLGLFLLSRFFRKREAYIC